MCIIVYIYINNYIIYNIHGNSEMVRTQIRKKSEASEEMSVMYGSIEENDF